MAMHQTNGKLPIEQANEILKKNIDKITSSRKWKEMMGWQNEAKFSRAYRKLCGIRPSGRVVELKVAVAIELLKNNRELSCFDIAQHIGKANDKALNKFLKYHTGKSPSWYRNNVQSTKKIGS